MTGNFIDEGEAEGLPAVERYGVLDTPPDGAFDRIAALAARLLRVPIAIVSIVDTHGIFKPHHGLDVEETGREPGLCASAVLQGGPWLIEDASVDVHSMADPVVAKELGMRFYAGIPLTTYDGYNLGTLCVIDNRPRTITDDEVDTLHDLAALVMNELELRRSARRTATADADGRRAAEVRFRTGFEQSPVGISLQSREGRFLMVNPALCKMLDRTEAELRTMNVAQVTHPDVVGADTAATARMLSGDTESLQAQTCWLRSDGEAAVVLMNVSLVHDANGNPDYFFSQAQDITRTWRAERRTRSIAELRRKALAGTTVEELMEGAVRAVATGLNLECAKVHVVKSTGRLSLAAGLGCPPERQDATDDGHALFTIEMGEPVVVADLADETRFLPPPQLVAQGFVSGMTVLITVRAGTHGVLSAYSTRPRRFSPGDIDFAQAVAELLGRAIERRDHDQAQQALHQQERLAAVGQLAAGVAHDFNNIVSAISLYAELLEGRQDLDGMARDHLGAIRQQVERATALVWQVLDFAHRGPLELVNVELSSFLAGLRPILRRTLPDTVEINLVELGRGPHVVLGDPTRLQQIFLNLATNASDAFDDRGKVTITLSVDEGPSDANSFDGPNRGRWVRVDFTDTGRGMTPEVLSRVFEPFFTTKPAAGGTGLGLSQVHGLVSQQHGHIVIDSSPERGTTVSIWFRPAEPGMPGEEAGQLEIPRAQGERLVLVDDDSAVRTALGQVLESLGYVVTLAADAEEVVGMLQRDSTSVKGIVSDVVMPGMDGDELARIVLERWPALPVVLISGYPIRGPHGEVGVADGPFEHPGRVVRLAKPFTRIELAETLRSAMS